MNRTREAPTIRTGIETVRFRIGRVLLLLPAALLIFGVAGCGPEEREQETDEERPIAGIEPGEIARLPDFGSIAGAAERKKQFFDFLRPIVRAENARVRKARRRMMDLYLKHLGGEAVSPSDSTWLERLADEYDLDPYEIYSHKFWLSLQRRVDTIPLALALIQAANESAWGTSRFAREGNSLFGQWCFGRGCGMVPGRRPAGETHKVAAFPSVNRSVRSYIHNLNTHPAYRELRRLRLDERRAGRTPSAHLLASGLVRYSERGEAYLYEIRRMLRVNRRLMGLHRPDARNLPGVSPDSGKSAGPLAVSEAGITRARGEENRHE